MRPFWSDDKSRPSKGDERMKRLLSIVIVVCMAACVSGGCCSKEEQDEDTAGVGDVIDYAIGKTPIEQGKRMEQDIRSIQKEHDEQLEKVLTEDE